VRHGLFGVHYGDVFEVAVELFVVEAEADDEAVEDFEAAVVDLDLDDAAGGGRVGIHLNSASVPDQR